MLNANVWKFPQVTNSVRISLEYISAIVLLNEFLEQKCLKLLSIDLGFQKTIELLKQNAKIEMISWDEIWMIKKNTLFWFWFCFYLQMKEKIVWYIEYFSRRKVSIFNSNSEHSTGCHSKKIQLDNSFSLEKNECELINAKLLFSSQFWKFFNIHQECWDFDCDAVSLLERTLQFKELVYQFTNVNQIRIHVLSYLQNFTIFNNVPKLILH